jgi:hypothetical protein
MALPYVDTAGVWDWSIYQGDTRVWSFSLELEDVTNTAINVASATITMAIKKQRGATVPTIWTGNTVGGEVTVTGAGNNTVTVTIPATNTAQFPMGALVYDVEFTEGSQVVTYLTGTIDVTREVTP